VGLTENGIKVIDKAIEVRFIEATDSVNIFDKKEKEDISTLLRKLLISLEN
jgi:hypothetical protein